MPVRQLIELSTNPLVSRSRRKLAEAAFFLDQLRRSEGRHPGFGYYLSAFLSALRSVGLVLQADLRGRFGAAFDGWWETAKASLPTMRVPFSVIVELRNQALKRGELLPQMIVTVRVDHQAVEEVAFTLDLQEGRIEVANESYKFRQGKGPLMQLANPNDSFEFDQEFKRVIPELRESFRSLEESNFDVASVAYLMERGGEAVSFSELVEGFAQHIAAMDRLLCDVEDRFKASPDPAA